jgi:hypothetical protein
MNPSNKLSKEQILAALARLNELLHGKRLNDGGYSNAFAASMVAYLCQVHDLKAPSWVNTESRRMAVPHFAAKTPAMKAILLQESPAAFRVRNLFVSANALSRA